MRNSEFGISMHETRHLVSYKEQSFSKSLLESSTDTGPLP